MLAGKKKEEKQKLMEKEEDLPNGMQSSRD